MRRTSRLPIVASFACALAAAGAWADSPTRDAGDIESAGSRDAGDIESATSGDLDEDSAASPRNAGDIDDAGSSDLEGAESDASTDLNDASVARSEDSDAAGAPTWEPPACDDAAFADTPVPPAGEASAWRSLLSDARSKAEETRVRLAAADDAYTYARNRQRPRGDALKEILTERDTARSEYARARCALPALVGRARRAGVSPDVWREYPASID